MPRDTQGFLQSLEKLGRAPSTVNRALATLRRFARWVHDQEGTPFQLGLPTKGVKQRAVQPIEAQKVESQNLHALLKAADKLVLTETRKNSRPRRNRAILSVFLYTGMRPQELVDLKLNQYDGKYLRQVKRKGNKYQDLYLSAKGISALDDYLNEERIKDDPDSELEPLFLSQKGIAFHRRRIGKILDHIAEEASKHRQEGQKVTLYPYQLRHTFAHRYHEKHGDTRTAEALGHNGTRYVGIYGRKTRKEHEADIDEMEF